MLRVYYRARTHGLEAVPKDRPVLYVAKHPRSYLYFETMLLGLFTFFSDRRWPEIQVMEKRDTSLHRTPLIGWLRRNVNTIPASEDAAVEALAAGRSVLVFPGGARELFGEPDVLHWAGHRGFARIAARAHVPLVPLAIAGADRQHLWRLRLGRSNTLWLPPLPLPARLDYWFGAPIAPPDHAAPDRLAAFAEAVEAETRALLAAASRAQLAKDGGTVDPHEEAASAPARPVDRTRRVEAVGPRPDVHG